MEEIVRSDMQIRIAKLESPFGLEPGSRGEKTKSIFVHVYTSQCLEPAIYATLAKARPSTRSRVPRNEASCRKSGSKGAKRQKGKPDRGKRCREENNERKRGVKPEGRRRMIFDFLRETILHSFAEGYRFFFFTRGE